MVPQNVFFFISTALLALNVRLGESIYCFQCNSYNHSNCVDIKRDHIWSSYYLPCEGESVGRSVFCRKLVQTIKIYGQEHVRVIRKCGWERHKKRDCYMNEDYDHREVICQCFEDGCNSATSLTANLFFATWIASHFEMPLFWQ